MTTAVRAQDARFPPHLAPGTLPGLEAPSIPQAPENGLAPPSVLPDATFPPRP